MQSRRALTEERKQVEEFFMVVCVIHQDVGCSSCFLLLLQTPGGPHKEGKLRGVTAKPLLQ